MWEGLWSITIRWPCDWLYLQDIEICVPEMLVAKAASLLNETGLFEFEEIEDFDLYNEYKRGYPRLWSSSWISLPHTFVLLADRSYGLDPIFKNVVSWDKIPANPSYRIQIIDLIPVAEVNHVPIPRLPSLFAGLCQRFLDTHDDVAMIAAEQLVDGMDLDRGWCERNLCSVSPEVIQLAIRLVAGKHSRLDDFLGKYSYLFNCRW